MNTHIVERVLWGITALLFVLSVIMFVVCFVVQPRILAAKYASVSLSEPPRAEIVNLVERYEPVVIDEPEIATEPEVVDIEVIETKIIEDLEAEPIEVIEGEVERPVYFDVPLDESLQDHIFAVCEEYGVDPALVMAVIEKESTFIVDAVGDYGRSLGLMQVQPQWFAAEMEEHGFDNLLDPYQNVVIGIGYLSDLFAMGRGDAWALMAYNGGPRYANEMGDWVSDYAAEVMERWGYFKGLGVN